MKNSGKDTSNMRKLGELRWVFTIISVKLRKLGKV